MPCSLLEMLADALEESRNHCMWMSPAYRLDCDRVVREILVAIHDESYTDDEDDDEDDEEDDDT